LAFVTAGAASGVDPLSRMLATAKTFADVTCITMEERPTGYAAASSSLSMRVAIPKRMSRFCGHDVIRALSGSTIDPPDPLSVRLDFQQPDARLKEFHAWF
jgi:hypothetical protein